MDKVRILLKAESHVLLNDITWNWTSVLIRNVAAVISIPNHLVPRLKAIKRARFNFNLGDV